MLSSIARFVFHYSLMLSPNGCPQCPYGCSEYVENCPFVCALMLKTKYIWMFWRYAFLLMFTLWWWFIVRACSSEQDFYCQAVLAYFIRAIQAGCVHECSCSCSDLGDKFSYLAFMWLLWLLQGQPKVVTFGVHNLDLHPLLVFRLQCLLKIDSQQATTLCSWHPQSCWSYEALWRSTDYSRWWIAALLNWYGCFVIDWGLSNPGMNFLNLGATNRECW